MTLNDNAYASFMLDYATGGLSPAERLAAELHRALSVEGGRNSLMLEVAGGAMLENLSCDGEVPETRPAERTSRPEPGLAGASNLDRYINSDLLALPWRRSLFGVNTLPTEYRAASLLRLDPGERAPQHGHGGRDVTVVLCGSFADEFGVYERGDLAFAEAGMKHEPRAVGDAPCVCLIAAEPGRPWRGVLRLLGWVGA